MTTSGFGLVRGLVYGLVLLLVFIDLASMGFLLMNPEGYWDHVKIGGYKAVRIIGSLFTLQAALGLASLYSFYRGWRLAAAILLFTLSVAHAYSAMHICASCRVSTGDAGEAVVALLASILSFIDRYITS